MVRLTRRATATRPRGQLVLLAAAVVAVALAPAVLAYLQLGYHPDVEATTDHDDPAANAVRFLERAVHEASVGIPTEYDWAARQPAVRTVRTRLGPRLATLERSRVEEGIAYRIAYNRTAARRWLATNCPSGPGRAFGPCTARRGVAVQERAGDTHVLAVALDLTVTTDRGRTDLTLLVRAVGGRPPRGDDL